MSPVIDLHAHLLPGLDDGPSTMEATLRMAEAAVAAGTGTMACTPHVASNFRNEPARVAEAAERTRDALEAAGIPLRIVTGGEIALDWFPALDDDALRGAALGGTGRHLLIEMPFRGWPLQLPDMLDGLAMRGYRVVLGHPERAESVQREPARLRDLVARGAIVQITASSLTGDHGRMARQTAATLLRNGLAHVLASDAHSHEWRPPGLVPGLEAAARVLRCEPEELSWMVTEGPAQIIAGETVRIPRLGVPSPLPAAAPASTPRRPPRAPAGPPRRGGGDRRRGGGAPQTSR